MEMRIVVPEAASAGVRVLDTVEGRLDERAAGPAEMWLGTSSYRVVRWAPAKARQ